MRAKELMARDWVISRKRGRDEYLKVVTIDDGNDIMWLDEGVYSGLVNADDIYPISLTGEILKANGWETGTYSTLRIDDNKWLEYYHHEHRLRMWWKGVDEWQNHSEQKELCFQCECHYVHQFQHALRLCGLTELADNFKIKADEE